MNKTAFIRARIEPELKNEAEAIFKEFGMTASQVITMLYKQVSRKHEIPFDLNLPNKKTARAIEEARTGRGIVACKDTGDLFNKLGL